MNLRRICCFTIILFVSIVLLCNNLLNFNLKNNMDIVYTNKVLKSVEANWGNLKEEDYKDDYINFTVIDNEENIILKTKDDISTSIHESILNKDVMLDIVVDNKIVGKVLFYNETSKYIENLINKIRFILVGFLVILLIIYLLLIFYLNKNIISPFRKIQEFAQNIAKGNFEDTLKMDRNNIFGAFTEAFDIMRDELLKSKQKLYKSECSKKELIASLSHDIKTPVATIKSVSELMMLKKRDEKEMRQIQTINYKADTINLLISDLFTSTLKDLEELEIVIEELDSSVISQIIKNNNYCDYIFIDDIPECVITAHKIRLEQIINNIINNSNKYAGTKIDVKSKIAGNYLEVNFKDYGKGIDEEEIPLIFNKFYRGKNSKDKSGAGLGLYIAKSFMEKMDGSIRCFNEEDGFVIRLMLKLA